MPRPDGVQAVQPLLGFVNYLAIFLSHLSEVCEPLRRLTDKGAIWCWQPQHDKAEEVIKKLVTNYPVLRYYDVMSQLSYSVMAVKLVWERHSCRMGNLWPMPRGHWHQRSVDMHRSRRNVLLFSSLAKGLTYMSMEARDVLSSLTTSHGR